MLRIEETELEDAKNRAARKLSREVKLKGFRQGKAPRRVVEAAVGPGAVRSEAIDDALPGFVTEAVRAAELDPVVAPTVEKIDDVDGGVEAAVRITMWPVVETPPDAAGRMIEVDDVVVGDDEIQEYVDRLRDQFSELEDVDRAAATGDFVTIDLSATHDGHEVPEAAASGLLYEIGSESFFPGLDDALAGKTAGDIVEFATTLPDGFGDHGGADVAMKALVKGVKAKRLPDVSDEWVSDVSEFDTVAEMEETLRRDLGRRKLEAARGQFLNRLVEALAEEMDLELPEALIRAETEAAIHDFSHRLEDQGMSIEQYMQFSGLTPDALVADFRTGAERSLRTRILLEAVVAAEGLELDDAEYDDTVSRIADGAERPVEEVRDQLVATGQDKSLAGDILRRKALDLLGERATPVDAAGNPVDLTIPDETNSGEHDDDTGPGPGEVDE
jgi:trigger factor